MPPLHPLPVLGGVFYARVEGSASGRPVSNIMCFQKAGVPIGDPSDAVNASHVATILQAQWGTIATDALHVSYENTQTSCYALGSPLIPPFISAGSNLGGRAGSSEFIQVAGLIKHTVYRRGKGSQSRTFLSPISIADIVPSGVSMTSAWVTSVNTGFPFMLSNILSGLNTVSPGSWTYVQLSKKGTGATFPVISSIAELDVSSQRRRLGR